MPKYLEIINGEITINAEILAELNKVRQDKANIDKRYKELTSGILKECAEDYDNRISRISGYNIVQKGGSYTLEFDLERFKVENPIQYANYCQVAKTDESYSLVYTKRG